MTKKPVPPRTTKIIKILLADNRTVDAELIYYPRYRSFLRAGAACIELKVEGEGNYFQKGLDYFEALSRMRKEIEAQGIKMLCWGARKDVWASGMQRDMGAGLSAYQLLEDGRNSPAQSIFDYAPPETIGTVEEQEENAKRWLQKKSREAR